MKEATADRVSRRVILESECLVWQGARDKDGYGIIQLDGKPKKVHQVVWFIANGPIPRGLVVRHAVCDNPPCARLEHLALGTHADNMADMVAHGRSNAPRGDGHYMRRNPRYGEQHNSTKLSDADVERVLVAHRSGMFTQKEIARLFGVSQTHVSRIVRGESRWLRRPQESQA